MASPRAPAHRPSDVRAAASRRHLIGAGAVPSSDVLVHAGNRAVQRLAIKAHNGIGASAVVTKALNKVLGAAEAKGGGAATGATLTRLTGILQQASAAGTGWTHSAQATYGISGRGTGATATTYIQGPTKFRDAVLTVEPNAVYIGRRNPRVHDEVVHLRRDPAIEGVLSTQDNCIFCYGMLESKGCEHGPLRASRFPEGWNHHKHDFELQRTNPDLGATNVHNPVVAIDSTLASSFAYYRVAGSA